MAKPNEELAILLKELPRHGSGTRYAGIARAKDGPFHCLNCEYWKEKSVCEEEHVMRDPEKGKADSQGRPYLAAEDCCDWHSKKGKDDGKS